MKVERSVFKYVRIRARVLCWILSNEFLNIPSEFYKLWELKIAEKMDNDVETSIFHFLIIIIYIIYHICIIYHTVSTY